MVETGCSMVWAPDRVALLIGLFLQQLWEFVVALQCTYSMRTKSKEAALRI